MINGFEVFDVHHHVGDASAVLGITAPTTDIADLDEEVTQRERVMAEGGVIRSEAVRHPLEKLHPATRAGLIELARAADPLALRWGK